MRICVPLCLLMAAAGLIGCGRSPTATLSRDNLDLAIRSDSTVYYPFNSFSGTLTFTNTGEWTIRESFPREGQYHVDFYDEDGVLRRGYFPNAQYPRASCFELEPLASRTDTLKFVLSDSTVKLPPGEYRVVAWIDAHPEISSATSIVLNY